MKKWIRKSLVRKLNNFKGLTPANVHRVETTTITFLNDNRIVKICTIKDDEVILIPKKFLMLWYPVDFLLLEIF